MRQRRCHLVDRLRDSTDSLCTMFTSDQPILHSLDSPYWSSLIGNEVHVQKTTAENFTIMFSAALWANFAQCDWSAAPDVTEWSESEYNKPEHFQNIFFVNCKFSSQQCHIWHDVQSFSFGFNFLFIAE